MKKNLTKSVFFTMIIVTVFTFFACKNVDPLSNPFSYESLSQKPFAERFAFLGEKPINELPETATQAGWYSIKPSDEAYYYMFYFDKDATNSYIFENENSGFTRSYLTITHPKADCEKRVLILTANNFGELNSMQALYSDKTFYNIEVNQTAYLLVDTTGFYDTYDEATETYTKYDFNRINWSVQDATLVSVEKDNENPKRCSIKGLKTGRTKVTATLENYSCDFDVVVYPTGTINIDREEVYLTTKSNVISLKKIGETTTVYVDAVNLEPYEYSKITWQSENENVATVVSERNHAVFTAVSEGETIINVSEEKSQNVLKIYVRVGSEYITQGGKTIDASCFVSTSQNYIRTKVGAEPTQLDITLRGGDDGDENNFTWTVTNSALDGSNSDVIRLETTNGNVEKGVVNRSAAFTYAFGSSYITPLKEGTATITITHPKILYPTEVLVKVLNEQAVLEEPIYLGGNGCIKILNGGTQDYTARLTGKNKKPNDENTISWALSDNRLSLVANEDTATITAPASTGLGVHGFTFTFSEDITKENTSDYVSDNCALSVSYGTEKLEYFKTCKGWNYISDDIYEKYKAILPKELKLTQEQLNKYYKEKQK